MVRRLLALMTSAVPIFAACGTGETTPAPTGTPSPGGSSGPTQAPPTQASVPLTHAADTLVVAVDAFNGDFDPASAYVLSEALIWRGIYEGLVRLKGDSASEVEPLLADSWTTKERKSTRLNSSHIQKSRMPSSA